MSKDTIYRQAAIDALGEMHCKSDEDGYVWIVRSDAWSRIDTLPSAQPDITDIEDALALLDGIRSSGRLEYNDYSDLHDAISTIVPSAQPEIIACGDCKHWICHDRRCGYWNHGVNPLEWCCHAERKADG